MLGSWLPVELSPVLPVRHEAIDSEPPLLCFLVSGQLVTQTSRRSSMLPGPTRSSHRSLASFGTPPTGASGSPHLPQGHRRDELGMELGPHPSCVQHCCMVVDGPRSF